MPFGAAMNPGCAGVSAWQLTHRLMTISWARELSSALLNDGSAEEESAEEALWDVGFISGLIDQMIPMISNAAMISVIGDAWPL